MRNRFISSVWHVSGYKEGHYITKPSTIDYIKAFTYMKVFKYVYKLKDTIIDVVVRSNIKYLKPMQNWEE